MKRIVVLLLSSMLAGVVWYARTNNEGIKTADFVIFSYNRPLQLYALLESIERYCKGVGEIHVIYRASDEPFKQGYQIVRSDFRNVQYHMQGIHPHQDFKPLTLTATFASPAAYIIFAVDDIVVKDTIDVSAAIAALERYNAYGFYFRLGKNLTNCYSYGSAAQPLPPFCHETSTIVSWKFNEGTFDWCYPHTVDMTLYRKKDIEADLRLYTYHTPNKLEDIWNLRAHAILAKRGLCYVTSKMVNMPLNRVQQDYHNRAMEVWKPEALLQELLAGKKMDIAPLYCVHNTAAHMEYAPTFINR